MSYNLHNLRVIGLEVAELLYCTIQGRMGEHSSLTLGAYLKGERKPFMNCLRFPL